MVAPINHVNYETVINNIEFAQKALEIHDIIPLLSFTRLADVLASVEGRVDCRITGGVNESNQAYLALQLQSNLMLVCQRCMQPMAYQLDFQSRYLLVASESEMPAPEDDVGDDDYLLLDKQMRVMDLIEDEVLLALPIAPLHSEGACSAGITKGKDNTPNPFAKLAALKTNSKSGEV